MKKTLTVLLVLVLLFSLCACGEDDPNAGLYTCRKIEASGITMGVEDVFPKGVTLELKNGGRGILDVEGDSGTIKWAMDGDKFIMETSDGTSEGTLIDGVITVNAISSGMTYTLFKEGFFSPGVIYGNNYESYFLGLSCSLSNDWKVLTREEMDERFDQVSGYLSNESHQLTKEFFYDFFAERNDGSETINVVIQNLGEKYKYIDKYSAKELLEAGKETMVSQYEAAGVSITDFQIDTMNLAGKEYASAVANGSIKGVPYYMKQAVNIVNGFEVVITFISLNTDKIDAMVQFFYQYGKAPSEDVLVKDEQPVLNSLIPPWWNGDWYGWWQSENSKGQFPESWYDAFAEVEIMSNGSVYMALWDEGYERSDPMAEVAFRFEESTTDKGRLVSTTGYFYSMEIKEGDWIIDPDDVIIDEAFMIEGHYQDSDGEDFDFFFVLRPWGIDWSDMDEEDLPYFYYNWYLPLIEAGEPMPDFIPEDIIEAAYGS